MLLPHLPLFNALSAISRLEFEARSGPGSRMNWNHRGSGTVDVKVDGNDIHFTEAFTLDNGTPCQDRKCWRFTDEGIIFRHHRQQQYQDIFLLGWNDSARAPETVTLLACAPYLCPPDTYDGTLHWHGERLTLSLRIIGAHKDEAIRYTYRPA